MSQRAAVLLGLRSLAREWRSGDLAVLFLALFVAVAALTGVGFLADRIDRAMQLQASEVLGADLRLYSPEVIGTRYDAEAEKQGLRHARVTWTISVVLKGDATQLTNVQVVSTGYPLRGKARVADRAFGEPQPATGIPAAGEIWPDSRLLSALGAQVGDVLTVGAASLRVTRVLISRPDQGSGFVDLVPSLLMNEADLAATQLIQPGSRATYAALFAGGRSDTQAFATWLKGHKTAAERLRDIADASPQVGRATERAARFLSMASLAGVLLCAVAIAMTARRYVQRHLDLAALLKTLGATRGSVLLLCLTQLVCIALVATVSGSAAGFLAQMGLLAVLGDLITTELPPPGWMPLLLGLAAALLLLIGFALPSMLRLARVPAMRVLRRDIGPPPLGAILAFGPAALTVALLVAEVTGDVRTALGFVAGLTLTTLALTLVALALVAVVSRLRGRLGVAWRYGAANLARRRAESVVQIVALGLGLSALLLLTILRGNLIDDWRAQLPRNAPNYFFVNIPPQDRDAFRGMIEADGGKLSRMLPMIRGRLVTINGAPADKRRFNNQRGEGFAGREQNLTWATEIGPDNRITEGHWFTAAEAGQPLISVAKDMQTSMGLKLGDKLGFDVAGESVEATISSFREVHWDSMQPNFFLMFAPGLLDGAAGTWMGSAQYRPTDPASIAALVRRFPSVSIFDMDDLLSQLRSILDKAVLAVQGVFVFTLLAGVVVLLAAVQVTRDERRYESAMLRTLGASRRTVIAGVLLEFLLIGSLAGIMAAAAASVGGYIVSTRLLDLPFRPEPLMWLGGALGSAALVCVAGYLATRSALLQPPMATLRQG
ncbi:MAG TPA: FtsX-like permease family protein [Steroidobacteraceae bacterium]|nr:FtsX-like permease family protein [Steroidobacteraceae bacterium]